MLDRKFFTKYGPDLGGLHEVINIPKPNNQAYTADALVGDCGILAKT